MKKLESALVALFALCGNEVPDMSAVMILRHGSKPLNVPPLRKAQYIVAVKEGWAPAPDQRHPEGHLGPRHGGKGRRHKRPSRHYPGLGEVSTAG